VEQLKEKYGPGLASAGRWAKVITEEVVKVRVRARVKVRVRLKGKGWA
jgi:hypothetical protein